MKKNLKSIFSALAAFAVVLSCSKVEGPDNYGNEIQGSVTISATLSDVLTKVAFAPSYGNDGKPESLALAWETGDKLRVYDHADKTKYEDFELSAESVGQKTGNFTGTLPVAASYDVEIISGDVEYAVQVQPADGVTSSLKYMASATGISDVTTITFTDYSSVLAITAKLPEGVAAVVGSVDITASEAIFNAGKTLTVSLTEKGDAGEDGVLNVFANLPQGDQQIPEGTTLLVRFNAPETAHTVYTRYVELGAQTFTAGKLNTVNINATESDIHAGVVASDGSSAEKAYLIGDKYQMQAMASLMVSGQTTYFKMVDDVDLTGVEWTPLNNETPYDKAIDFDGAGYTISNFVVGSADMAFPSFVGNLSGSVRDVTFDKAKITCGAQKGGVLAGSIGNDKSKGECRNVIIQNSTLTADEMLGAVAALGNDIGVMSGCKVINTTVTSTKARIGGLVGSISASEEISDCVAENVDVTSNSYYAGGLFGQFAGGGKISGCHSTGTVKSTPTNYARSGGLVGYLMSGAIENCYSGSNVTVGGQFGGGLVGEVAAGSISKCYVTGSVTSTANHYSGGMVGRLSGSLTVSESYFAGSVTLPSDKAQAGGIISYMDAGASAEISNCYTAGSISGRRWHGAIVGGANVSALSLKVTNCYTKTAITGSPYGALVGACSMPGASVACVGFIASWPSGTLDKDNTVTSTSYYIGQDISISAKAKEFNWDETIWDLSDNEPVLKWTLVE